MRLKFLIMVSVILWVFSVCFWNENDSAGVDYSISFVSGKSNINGKPDINGNSDENLNRLNLLIKFDSIVLSKDKMTICETDFPKEKIVSAFAYDLNMDGVDEVLLLIGTRRGQYANKLSILYFESNGFVEKGTFELTRFKPWKVQAADVDGDHKPEISIGVFKTAIFHPVMAKRPFVYTWENGNIVPKWLGSRLSRAFEDYIFQDVDGDGCDELISIENMENFNKVISVYKWSQFGFDEMSHSGEFLDVEWVKKGDEAQRLVAKVKDKGVWIEKDFGFRNNVLQENK